MSSLEELSTSEEKENNLNEFFELPRSQLAGALRLLTDLELLKLSELQLDELLYMSSLSDAECAEIATRRDETFMNLTLPPDVTGSVARTEVDILEDEIKSLGYQGRELRLSVMAIELQLSEARADLEALEAAVRFNDSEIANKRQQQEALLAENVVSLLDRLETRRKPPLDQAVGL